MKKLHIAFVWHMHQPLYKDDLENRYHLPWVRLHALKGYYDMPALLENFPAMKQTFNLTPSLLCQLEDYLNNDVRDNFLDVTLKPAAGLTPEDKEFILRNFFMNNWGTIVKPHVRYSELLNKRGLFASAEDIKSRVDKFEAQDYLDLQVLFNLTWFGFSYRKKEKRLEELFQKRANYTEADKKDLIDLQYKAMREIVPLYRKLAEKGQAELTTTPFYHPILPLISDKTLGYAYSWTEDARWHLKEGIALFEKHFGRRPRGMWPSEGSVSQDVVELFADEGIQWIATDEEILLHSDSENGSHIGAHGQREDHIYKPYLLRQGDKHVSAVFRDKKLSDLIGFSYCGSDPEAGASDFVRRLHDIRNHVEKLPGEHLVPVILDGENAWEYYIHGADKFLSAVYRKICEEPAFETVTVSEYLGRHPAQQVVKRLFAGSWINHDFHIWYGHEEDRLAWDYLAKTREFLAKESAPEEKKRAAWREIYIAEGSDWYWWYGDDFSTATQETFDFLFRNHLMNVYKILDARYPAYLKKPIKRPRQKKTHVDPAAFLAPEIDGQVTDFYEWANAGRFKIDDAREAMAQTSQIVTDIYYGFDLVLFFLRFDFSEDVKTSDLSSCHATIRMHCIGKRTNTENDYEVEFVLKNRSSAEIYTFENKKKVRKQVFKDDVRIGKILEMKVPFSAFGLEPGDEVHFTLSVKSAEGAILEEWPRHGVISFHVPDEMFENSMWSA